MKSGSSPHDATLTRLGRVRWTVRGEDGVRRQADATIVWLDAYPERTFYVLELDHGGYACARADELEVTGRSTSMAHLGTRPELGHDLIDASSFHEGVFRLPGRFWQVFTVHPTDVERLVVHASCTWPSGITGITIETPAGLQLTVSQVEHQLAVACGVASWTIVRGPDSMWLR